MFFYDLYNSQDTRSSTVWNFRTQVQSKLKIVQAKELREKLDNLKNLQDERDYYKAQASDLQAVEAAYAQAIKHSPPNVRSRGDCTDGSFLEDFQDKTRRLQGDFTSSDDVLHKTCVVWQWQKWNVKR